MQVFPRQEIMDESKPIKVEETKILIPPRFCHSCGSYFESNDEVHGYEIDDNTDGYDQDADHYLDIANFCMMLWWRAKDAS